MADTSRTPQQIRDAVAGFTAQAEEALAAGDSAGADSYIKQANELIDLHLEVTGVPIALDGSTLPLQFQGNFEASPTELLAGAGVDVANLTREEQAAQIAELDAAAEAAKPGEIEAAVKDWVQDSIAVDVSRLTAEELATFIEANRAALDQAMLRDIALPPEVTLLQPGGDPIVLDEVTKIREVLASDIPVVIPGSLEGKVGPPGSTTTPIPGSTGGTAGGRTGSTTPPPTGSTAPPPTGSTPVPGDRPDTGDVPTNDPSFDDATGGSGGTGATGTTPPPSSETPDTGAPGPGGDAPDGDATGPATPGDGATGGEGGVPGDTGLPMPGAEGGGTPGGTGTGPDGTALDGDLSGGSGLPAVPYHREVWLTEDGPSYFNDTSTGQWFDSAGNEITDPAAKAALDAFADQVAGPGDGDPLGAIVPSGKTAEEAAAEAAAAAGAAAGTDTAEKTETEKTEDTTETKTETGDTADTDDSSSGSTDDGDSGSGESDSGDGSGEGSEGSDGSEGGTDEGTSGDADADPPPDDAAERPGPDQVAPLDAGDAAHAGFLLGDIGDTSHRIRTQAAADADVNPTRDTGGELGTSSGTRLYDSEEISGFDPIVDPGEERLAFGSGELPTIGREDTGDIDPSDLPDDTGGGPHPFTPSTALDLATGVDAPLASAVDAVGGAEPFMEIEAATFDAELLESADLADRSGADGPLRDGTLDAARSGDLAAPDRADDDFDLD